eukprot:GHRR01034131.1.p1 GENE.GHRR01034131.1~~GHRR01034131.1.p1  ORF type:complete len:121 (-),score=30.30 GHRR01034131.1:4-366(-)
MIANLLTGQVYSGNRLDIRVPDVGVTGWRQSRQPSALMRTLHLFAVKRGQINAVQSSNYSSPTQQLVSSRPGNDRTGNAAAGIAKVAAPPAVNSRSSSLLGSVNGAVATLIGRVTWRSES